MNTTTVRVGGYAPKGSVHSRALDHFAAAVAAEANGEVQVEILYNVLDENRPASDLFDLVRSGQLHWCYYSSSYLGSSVPALNAIEVPFLFERVDEAHQALDGEFGAALAAEVLANEGFEVLGFWDNGLRHLTNSVRPIIEPADCDGLRIRLQPNDIHEALARSWGMKPIGAELSEGIAMIKRGDVEAQENPLANTVAYGVEHEYLTLTAHLYGARGLFANGHELSKLGDVADLVRRCASQAIGFQREAAASYELELQQRLTDEGRTLTVLSQSQRQAFADAAEIVIAEARSSVDPALLGLLTQNQPTTGATNKEEQSR